MIFTWWRQRRRRKLLARPFPQEWEHVLQTNVAHYRLLNPEERAKLRQCVQVFVAEKYWEGCGGLEITDEIRVTIAGQACLLLLGFDEQYFDRLLTVLVYPGDYLAPETEHRPGGVVLETVVPRLGEAWHGGPVILSWPRALEGARVPDDGENVLLHEFAHVLDMQDHAFDGTPILNRAEDYGTWHQVMTAEFHQLQRDAERGRPTLLDDYGATNEAEFFAVATECFFEQPTRMLKRHPQLYRLLQAFYRQDPAVRFATTPQG